MMFSDIRRFLSEQLRLDCGNGREQKEWLAGHLGYSYSTIDRFMRGTINVSRQFIECVADFYGKSAIYCNGRWRIVDNVQSGDRIP